MTKSTRKEYKPIIPTANWGRAHKPAVSFVDSGVTPHQLPHEIGVDKRVPASLQRGAHK